MKDPYAEAQFPSLWKVVVHATDDGEDRHAVYEVAHAAMLADHRWGPYRMLFNEDRGHHVGYYYANPKDWFILSDTGSIDGPFPTLRRCKRKLGAPRVKQMRAGVYCYKSWTLFTRDNAPAMDIHERRLP